MKKTKLFLIITFAILLFIAILVIIRKPIIESYFSKKLKTEVTFSKVSIGKSNVTLEDFKVKNLKNKNSKYAFQAKKIKVEYSFSKLFNSPSIIDNISIHDIDLAINCNDPLCKSNNWTEIINQINEKEKKIKDQKEIMISFLKLKNMNVDITGFGLDLTQRKTKHIDQLEFKNISNKTGFPTAKLIAAIFGSSGLKDYLKGVLDPRGLFDNVINSIKIFSVNEKVIDERVGQN